jgi:hypothetical protein
MSNETDAMTAAVEIERLLATTCEFWTLGKVDRIRLLTLIITNADTTRTIAR